MPQRRRHPLQRFQFARNELAVKFYDSSNPAHDVGQGRALPFAYLVSALRDHSATRLFRRHQRGQFPGQLLPQYPHDRRNDQPVLGRVKAAGQFCLAAVGERDGDGPARYVAVVGEFFVQRAASKVNGHGAKSKLAAPLGQLGKALIHGCGHAECFLEVPQS